jgi:hypothetical protein
MRNKFSIAVPALVLILGMSSCLKHNAENLPPTGQSVIEFGNTSVPESYSAKTKYAAYDNNNLLLQNDTTGFDFFIDYAGAQYNAPEDITITLAYDAKDSVLPYYNDSSGSDYHMPDPANFTFPSTLVLKKGTHQVYGHVHLQNVTNGIGFDTSRAIPLMITAVSSGIISGNYGTAIFQFSLANVFSGAYTTTGYFFHPTGERAINSDYTIYAAGVFACKIPLGDLGSSNYYFITDVPESGGALANYRVPASSAAPQPPGSGFMYADDPGGTVFAGASPAVEPGGSSPWQSSTYNNTYDAAAKTFWIHVGYNGTSQNNWSRQSYTKMVKD